MQIYLKWSFLFVLITGFNSPVYREAKNHLKPAFLHPFYISVTEINHNATEGSLELSCKMFRDDFENALKKQYKSAVDLVNPADKKKIDSYIFSYLQKHLQLKVNGRPAVYTYVGFETEGESTWCYLEIKNISEVKTIEISNNLLYESHDTQISIIHAMVAGKRKSTKMVNPEKLALFNF